MPVSRLYLVIIPCPLHYLTVLAYLRLGQAVSCSPDVAYCLGILVAAQDIISAYNCAEKGVKYLAVHGRAAAKRSRSAVGGVIGVLGGNGGVCHKAALVIFRQVIKEKLCAFNQSIKLFRKEILITGEEEMLPDVGAKPRQTHWPQGSGKPLVLGCCIAPDIGVVMTHRSPASVHTAGGNSAVLPHALDMVVKGRAALGQILHKCAPVVHLGIDVNGIFSAPRRPHILVPDALEIKGESSLTGACYHKVAGEVEVHSNQLIVIHAVLYVRKALICGLGNAFAHRREGKAASVKK